MRTKLVIQGRRGPVRPDGVFELIATARSVSLHILDSSQPRISLHLHELPLPSAVRDDTRNRAPALSVCNSAAEYALVYAPVGWVSASTSGRTEDSVARPSTYHISLVLVDLPWLLRQPRTGLERSDKFTNNPDHGVGASTLEFSESLRVLAIYN